MKQKQFLGVAAALLFAGWDHATAGIISVSVGVSSNIETVTVLGTVYSGVDKGGYFGPAGADLEGDPFSLVFVFDTSNGNFGGSFFGTPSPSLGAIFAINGKPMFIGGNYIASLSGPAPGNAVVDGQIRSGTQLWVNTQNLQGGQTDFAVFVLANFSGALPSFGVPFTYALTNNDYVVSAGVGLGLPANGPAGPQSDLITLHRPANVPGPVVGAGFPGVMMAVGGLLAWRRRARFENRHAIAA